MIMRPQQKCRIVLGRCSTLRNMKRWQFFGMDVRRPFLGRRKRGIICSATAPAQQACGRIGGVERTDEETRQADCRGLDRRGCQSAVT